MTTTPTSPSTPPTAEAPHKTDKKRIIILFLFLVVAVIAALIWWHDYNKYVSTDDANLDSYRIDVAPMVTGQITQLYVAEGDSVTKGQPLFDLEKESTSYQVTAPADGVIAKRWSLPGDVVNAGQTVFTLNQGNELWVAVYLEETKFSHIYLGQQVKFSLDAYDKLTFYGKIFYIGDNSASEFALVPPNNASGNYTKVTQRIPLKISIDRVDGDPQQRQHMKLVSGMSATVKIIKD